MVSRFLIPTLAGSLLLAGCLQAPSSSQTQGAGSAVLQLQPEIRSGGLRTQAAVSPYTIADIETLKLSLYKVDGQGNETVVKDSQQTPLTMSVPRSRLGDSIRFTKLHSNTTYRVKAMAYLDTDATQLISTTDAASRTDIPIAQDDRPTLARIGVKLIDKTFDGQGSSSFDVASGSLTPAGSESMELDLPPS